ncbi:hypothetical protein lerEdw1_010885 [Lerista edwardsae]|nr:hypothetical protein lerEdw1_010885 [Lerista edwardsae]
MRSGGRPAALLLLLLLALPPPPACIADEGPSEAQPGAGPHGPGHHRHWSYAGKAKWASDFSDCGGRRQSPIDIETAATHLSPQLTPLLLSGYNLPPGEQLFLQNNGHTIVLDLPGNMTLAGGGFPEPYKAAQLHLHWGSTSAGPGSEHTVDGHRFPGELHVVHYSSRFGSIVEAEREPGGLAVLAAFLQVGTEENEPYQHILEHLEEVHEEGEKTSLAGFDVAGLLPDNLDRYFRYDGSLTTPPCYQTVTWTLFNQTIRLSQEQISVLEDSLHGDNAELIQSNFRPPQSLNGRRVLASFPAGRTLPPGADKQLGSSLRTGDLLAILFGTLFALTAVAFLLYVQQHRGQSRQDPCAAKPSVLYAAATAEENLV